MKRYIIRLYIIFSTYTSKHMMFFCYFFITNFMSSKVPLASIALTNTCKVNLEISEIVGGNPKVMLVPVVSCHCKMSQPPSTVPTETS